ncbi:MAG: cyclic nucleotide-binding domain-containing protein [Candidatus Methylacidiphilales bacterium]|nr:cyclic nucleotide-binding domain-containing protein [Candidatus Methylacidiphilales bacterium]
MSTNEHLHFFQYLRSLAPEWQESFDQLAESRHIPAGANICRQGEPSDAVFIIEEGVAEVLLESDDFTRQRRVGYLAPGDIFGELGLLNDDPRSATVRAKVDVQARRLEREVFREFLDDLPGFGRFISCMLASRFKLLTAEVKYQSHCLHLRGNLPLFDLLMVFQTIRDSNAQGELLLWGTDNDPLGAFFFSGNTIQSAKHGQLRGPEAIWQALCDSSAKGTFAFQMMAQPMTDFEPSCTVSADLTDILMQGAMKRDYFAQLSEPLRQLRGTITLWADGLDWPDRETLPAAERIVDALKEAPRPVEEVWRESLVCSLTFGQIIEELIRTRQITLEEEEVYPLAAHA